MDGLAAKLTFLLKALALSRGRLAADLGVDKSVVSRWLSGASRPSAENLSQLTRLIADRLPGFTGLDWDSDLDGLAALVRRAPAAPSAAEVPGLVGLDQVRVRTQRHGPSWEGHWWGYRQTFREHDELVRDKIRIRRRGDFLAFDWCHDTVVGTGWFLVSDGKAYVLLPHRYADIPAMMTFYSMDGRQVQVLDGLITTVVISASREMIAAPYVIVRAANLLPDPVADDAFFAVRSPDSWSVDRGDVHDAIRARLAPASQKEGVLRIRSEPSLTRFCTPDEVAAAAAATRAAARDVLARDDDRFIGGSSLA